MSYTFQSYIADGQEHFLHGPSGHVQHTQYPFSQTVLEWMELDAEPIRDVTERLQTDLHQLITGKEERLEKPIAEGLALLNSYHMYFACLRLQWLERLKQARQAVVQGRRQTVACRRTGTDSRYARNDTATASGALA
ncbi:hypothetical protein LJK88_01030 [Paenibacillus sp. P26]|nr:hypothetical protein LJK88_01030 [Paenibacillus sp. P26]